MGEVYRARDPRLERMVALKVLPADLASDPERLQRFQREARAASALNHPHIVSIFDTGTIDGTSFIAMELVEGEPLSAWVQQQRPDLRRLLEVLTQIADALTAAHEAGIVHRDIKPANLLVTGQGYAKVLDFGLAKLVDTRDGSTPEATATGALSRVGTILGTVAYMSPEQAQGQPVDARTDVFSLGSVLYEAVAGRRPFEGPSEIDILHAIVRQPAPPIAEAVPGLPPQLQWILEKALAKERDQRYQSMKELAADLRRLRRWIDEPSSSAASMAVVPTKSAVRWRSPWIAATLAGVGTAAVIAALLLVPAVRTRLMPLAPSAVVGAKLVPLTSDLGYEGEPTLSPDGRTVAYVSDRTGNFDIFLKQVSGGPEINLTSHPADDVQPSFSPDGRQIAFVSSRDAMPLRPPAAGSPPLGGDIWVMSALGGAPRRVATGNFPSWSPDGQHLVFTAGQWFQRRIYRVNVNGGQPREVPITVGGRTELQGSPGDSPDLITPSYSSDGRYLAFSAQQTVFTVPAEGGKAQATAPGVSPAWSSEPLAIIYSTAEPGRNGSLWRVPFSTATGRPTGPPEPLTAGRAPDVGATVSRDGRQIALAGFEVTANIEALPFDFDGGQVRGAPRVLTTGTDEIYFAALSPDGRSVVYPAQHAMVRGLRRVDLGEPPVDLTSDPQYRDFYPRWRSDGRILAFSRQRADVKGLAAGGVFPMSGASSIWLMRPDGSELRQLPIGGRNGFFEWTPDGRGIVFQADKDRQFHVFDLDSQQDRRITDEPGMLPVVAVSRDGQWVAFQSNPPAQGKVTIRVAPMSGGASKQVAEMPGNCYHPFFSPSGKWLYFQVEHADFYRVPGPVQEWKAAQPERVTNFAEPGVFLENPQAAPDGSAMFYARRHLASDVWVLTLR